jgi:hypothetical protein
MRTPGQERALRPNENLVGNDRSQGTADAAQGCVRGHGISRPVLLRLATPTRTNICSNVSSRTDRNGGIDPLSRLRFSGRPTGSACQRSFGECVVTIRNLDDQSFAFASGQGGLLRNRTVRFHLRQSARPDPDWPLRRTRTGHSTATIFYARIRCNQRQSDCFSADSSFAVWVRRIDPSARPTTPSAAEALPSLVRVCRQLTTT